MPTPYPETTATGVPSPAELRRALAAFRYGQSLADSPLGHLDAVWEILLREGVAAGPEGRAWALGLLLQELVGEQLARARRAAGQPVADGLPGGDQLAADFAAGSVELELWSALYHRYLDPGLLQVGEMTARLGIPRRTRGRRRAAGQRRLAEALAARDREAARRVRGRADLPLVAPADAPRPGPAAVGPAPRDALLRAVRHAGERRVSLTPEALERLTAEPPRDLDDYRLSRVAAWSRPDFRLDARFVRLTLLLDRGEDAPERWRAEGEAYDDLAQLLAGIDSPALVLLGQPGSGKSTLLRRLELDLAVAGLRGESEAIPFFVSLTRYGADAAGAAPPAPAAWLADLWDRRFPSLPSFDRLLAGRRLVLLLDGLNEMPHGGFEDYRARVLAWKRFLGETAADFPGTRLVFACRSLDYGAPLSSPEQRVPQVRVEPLSDPQVRAFLRRYAPARAEGLWAALRGRPQLELVRSPYLLSLLVEESLVTGAAPIGRAALFTRFVRRALLREIERDHPLFQPGPLLDERDYRRAVSGRQWARPWALPDRGALVPGLTRLAEGVQRRVAEGRASPARVSYDEALALIDHPAAAEILRAGEALGILDEHRGRDEVLFAHPLQQEYFAARHLADDPPGAAARCRRSLRAADAVPALEAVVAELAAEPLPLLPSTGWEEIVLLAATMSEDPAVFVEAVGAANPALAAPAAAQVDLVDRLAAEQLAALRARLVEIGGDEGYDLRARLEAGLALGALGDPRFSPGSGPEGSYLLPPLVAVPAGDYVIGSGADPEGGAAPEHRLRLPAFEIGRFPVTHAEWAHFMAAGGYEDPRWWDTPDALAWQRGDLTAEGSRRWVREWLAKMRAEPGLLEHYVAEGMRAEQEAMWRERLAMDEAELERHLAAKYPRRRHVAPHLQDPSLHGAPTQPVAGISWYEARAYCRWLSAQTGLAFRLPREVEWEAAARGGDARPYPWGARFDLAAANTLERRLRRAAPVGVMPRGRAPCGAEMMAGDVLEWTSSLWGPAVETSAFGYPYVAGDGREEDAAPPTIRRVQRGGSYIEAAGRCQVFHRTGMPPDTRFTGFGMRLARTP